MSVPGIRHTGVLLAYDVGETCKASRQPGRWEHAHLVRGGDPDLPSAASSAADGEETQMPEKDGGTSSFSVTPFPGFHPPAPPHSQGKLKALTPRL